MMTKYFRVGKLLSIILLSLSSSLNAQTYTVTSTSMGGPSSLNTIMTNAIIAANSGSSVVIYLNAGATIPVTTPLPILNHDSGSISILKHPLSNAHEGIIASGPSGPHGFVIQAKGAVVIEDILIKGFPSDGIHIQCAATSSTEGNIDINGNSFENNGTGIFFSAYIDYEITNLNINNNDFSCVSPSANGIRIETGFDLFGNDFNFANINISQNSISNFQYGIRIWNYETNVKNIGSLVIDNNIIQNCQTGISMIRHNENWVITNNTLSNDKIGIAMFSHHIPAYPSVFAYNFDFIEGVENYNNDFVNCYLYSYYLGHIDNINISNVEDIEGTITVGYLGIPVTISECLIKKPIDYDAGVFGPFEPIKLTGGNGGIHSANPTSAILIGTDLTVNYELPGLNFSTNGPFIIEFFVANSDNSLLQFIGNQTVSSSLASYTATFSNVLLLGGDRIGISVTSVGGTKLGTSNVAFIEIDYTPLPCDPCHSFTPIPGEEYWISAWVNVDYGSQQKTYNNGTGGVYLELTFNGGTIPGPTLFPTGEIIDGWQRVVGKFTVPTGAIDITLDLNAHPQFDTYFDDIRIHPFNASMKSYVYDGETFWLVSELDDNNYATYYEYDEEGGLIRIKKETERGIVTIQETRSSTVKQ